MSANTLLTSTVTGGVNSHTTTAEEANALSTDFVTQGVVGAITLNTGSAGTGSFCVNADASPDMGVAIKSGQAYVTATPSSQNSQVLRVRASSDYTAYTINANSSGSTKYDWIYLSISASNANAPSSDGSNVASFTTSRSSSNTTDNGTPPTYGLLLAIVTVANGASSITNSNITDKRFNASVGAQNGSLIVTQNGTGTDAKIQAAGIDTNVNISITPKGTGVVEVGENGSSVAQLSASGSDTNIPLDLRGKGNKGALLELRTQTDNGNTIVSATTSAVRMQMGWGQVVGNDATALTDAITFPTAFTTILGVNVNMLSAKTSPAAADITGLNTSLSGGTGYNAAASSITTSGFTANLTRNTGTYASTLFWGYSWIAWGV